MIVVLDNRDSFVFNLARHFRLLGAPVAVVPSHGMTVTSITRLRPSAIVVSPGPCTPREAGCSIDAIRSFRGRIPILGVCLGHQAIGAALGARIIQATPTHGRTSEILHDSVNLFAGIPSPMTACRYHSLVVDPDSLPHSLAVTARDPAGTIMAIADEPCAVYGVQFHPESILTRHGFRLLANFLDVTGVPHAGRWAHVLDGDTVAQSTVPAPRAPETDRVVTF
jgi:anthranilate synthase/aminodeoxychorismate synthase-like glutamine amidotransferase